MKLFVSEVGSEAVVQFVERTEDRRKLVSKLALIEVRSGIRRRQYAGDTPQSEAEEAVRSIVSESLRLRQFSVNPQVLKISAELVDRRRLRTLDSIQLATAILARNALSETDQIEFIASDTKLLEAAVAESFSIWNPVVSDRP